MQLVSTVGQAPPVDLKAALLESLAPDGGLYVFERWEPVAVHRLDGLRGRSFPETARFLAAHLLGGAIPPPALERIVDEALNFPVPLVQLDEKLFVLELFHGPTFAFKDVGARFLARLLIHLLAGEERELTVIVATSGDTGGAVAHAFYGLPRTRVIVLFPDGRVSPVQERQFSTLGGNVLAVAVQGSFDDCQRLAKRALRDRSLQEEFLLASANSINLGRLVPQVFYYFHALNQLPHWGGEVIVSVPSGNLGNLTAGLMAKRLGLPVTRFVAATNANDVLVEYLRNGYYRPRPARPTVSPAMDVGDPSNLARIAWLYGGDLERLKSDLEARAYTDEQTLEAIADFAHAFDYLLDPHSAVGALGLRDAMAKRPSATGVFLATAHPAKFASVVGRATGRTVPLPSGLDFSGRPTRVVRLKPELESLRDLLSTARGVS